MDLWIRSQNKTRLSKIKDIYVVDTNDQVAICGYSSDESDDFDLGIYPTIERALEVLDNIRSCIETNTAFQLYSHMGNFPYDFNRKYNYVAVFQMPEK